MNNNNKRKSSENKENKIIVANKKYKCENIYLTDDKFVVGSLLQVKDFNKWYPAKIIDREESRIKIHFHGWNSRFDRFIDISDKSCLRFYNNQDLVEIQNNRKRGRSSLRQASEEDLSKKSNEDELSEEEESKYRKNYGSSNCTKDSIQKTNQL